MSNSNKSNDRIDLFSDYIRERLVDKSTFPDTDCWEKIDARLQKKRAISPVLYGLAVAASIIVTVFLINITSSKDEQPAQNEMTVVEPAVIDKVLKEEEPTQEKDYGKLLENKLKEIIANAKQVEVKDRSTDISVEKKEEGSSQKKEELSSQNKEEEDLSQKIIEETPDDIEVKKVYREQPSVQKETDKQQYKGLDNLIAYNKKRSRENSDWQLSAGFGSVGGAGSFINFSKGDLVYETNDPNYIEKNPPFNDGKETQNSQDEEIGYIDLPGVENGGNNGLDASPGDGKEDEPGKNLSNPHYNNKIKDIRPSVPISFGVTVRKKLNSTIGIETGLVYTFLSTDITVIDGGRSEITQKLHYLGVPANLIVNLYDKRSWNIYVSAGGMIEKGLVSVYQSKSYNVYKNSEITENRSISGLQWSLNGGVGLSYGIYKDINMYVEPGFSYYFDNDQPISKRTEDPFTFNLKVGLRYDF